MESNRVVEGEDGRLHTIIPVRCRVDTEYAYEARCTRHTLRTEASRYQIGVMVTEKCAQMMPSTPFNEFEAHLVITYKKS